MSKIAKFIRHDDGWYDEHGEYHPLDVSFIDDLPVGTVLAIKQPDRKYRAKGVSEVEVGKGGSDD